MKKYLSHVGLTVAAAALLLGAGRAVAVDVSQFLVIENQAAITSGSPGGIAWNGTNFLIAAQTANGGIMAIRLTTNWTVPGAPLELGRTGGVPRVAFDGGNCLLVWPDYGELPSDIYGQFIGPEGAAAGNPFLIEADVDAKEIGGLAFDGTNYLAVWETNERNSNGVSTVQGRLISRAGSVLGTRLQISDGVTPQKYPAVAWNGETYLVLWTGQTEGTNEWQVRGRRISREGTPLDSMVISSNAAQQAWPPTVASDGTNWLAAWSRETGPYLVAYTNLWLPMLYGRIVARDGTVSGPEVQIRLGGLAHIRPRALFNGTHYVVAWMERLRPSHFLEPQPAGWEWKVVVRQLNGMGQPVMAEIQLLHMNNPSGVEPPGLAVSQGAGRFLAAWKSVYGDYIEKLALVRLHRDSLAFRNVTRLPGDDMQFNLVGPTNRSYGFEVSSNLVDWSFIMLGTYGWNSPVVGSSRVDLQACKLEYSIVSPK